MDARARRARAAREAACAECHRVAAMLRKLKCLFATHVACGSLLFALCACAATQASRGVLHSRPLLRVHVLGAARCAAVKAIVFRYICRVCGRVRLYPDATYGFSKCVITGL